MTRRTHRRSEEYGQQDDAQRSVLARIQEIVKGSNNLLPGCPLASSGPLCVEPSHYLLGLLEPHKWFLCDGIFERTLQPKIPRQNATAPRTGLPAANCSDSSKAGASKRFREEVRNLDILLATAHTKGSIFIIVIIVIISNVSSFSISVHFAVTWLRLPPRCSLKPPVPCDWYPGAISQAYKPSHIFHYFHSPHCTWLYVDGIWHLMLFPSSN